MVIASAIKPDQTGRSGFFSWQLYRYVKRHRSDSEQRVWAGTWSPIFGIDRNSPVLYIGCERDGEWIHAVRLRDLCRQGSPITRWAYGPGHDTPRWVDVTDKFWSEYMEKGVCAIHGDAAHKWQQGDNKRRCEYCGKREVLESKMVEQFHWVAQGPGE